MTGAVTATVLEDAPCCAIRSSCRLPTPLHARNASGRRVCTCRRERRFDNVHRGDLKGSVMGNGGKLVYISFSAEVNVSTTENLLAVCAQQVSEGVDHIYLLISTQGGN